MCKKDYIWNPSTYSFENGQCLESIVNDSAIMCDEIIESYVKETKTIPTNFNEKIAICKMQKLCILKAFLLITKVLLITISIYCYLIKY